MEQILLEHFLNTKVTKNEKYQQEIARRNCYSTSNQIKISVGQPMSPLRGHANH